MHTRQAVGHGRWRNGWARARAAAVAAGLTILVAAPSGAREQIPIYRQVAGEIRRIEVSSGDTLVSIGARVGVPWRVIAQRNGLDNPNRIYRGQVLEADTRRIVPALVDEGLVVNVPEAAMYRFEAGAFADRYTVGLGRPQFPTPLGSFTVLRKERTPGALSPATLAEELENEAAVARHKAGPEAGSTLGELWLQLSAWGYGIHGTPFTATLGQFLGYGSVRTALGVMAELFEQVDPGTAVIVTYQPVKLAVTPAGEVWVEAHPDVYGRGSLGFEQVLERLREAAPTARIDENDLWAVLDEMSGVARRVGEVPVAAGGLTATDAGAGEEAAQWTCLDCPPRGRRRVTFQLRALAPLVLPNPFPLRIFNDANLVVFRPPLVAQATVPMAAGERRNFVWEVRDAAGQPLPPGSYAAVIEFLDREGHPQSLSLPLWVGK